MHIRLLGKVFLYKNDVKLLAVLIEISDKNKLTVDISPSK